MTGHATLIKARWIVGYAQGEHRLIENGCLAYAGSEIIHVGRHYEGPVGQVIEAPDHLVIPGFVSAHTHFVHFAPPADSQGRFVEPGQDDDREAAIRFAMASLVRHGITTAVDAGGATCAGGGPTMKRLVAEAGLRLYASPLIRTLDNRSGEGRWGRGLDEKAGDASLEEALAFADDYHGRCDGRLSAMLVLDEICNATPRLLQRVKEAAGRLGLGISLTVGDRVWEFQHVLRTTGRTPIQMLDEVGFLGPEVILGHARLIGGNSRTGYPYDDDLDIIARKGATVAHVPLAGLRRGEPLESFDRYRRKGIRMALGTAAYPLDMISEMRWAALGCKIEDRDHEAAPAKAVFDAATLGGADALGRPDLGRLAPGAKADMVIVDFATLRAGPVRDPIRTLVHAATGENVETVIVDGEVLMRSGRLLRVDEKALLRDLRASAHDGSASSFPAWAEPNVSATEPKQ